MNLIIAQIHTRSRLRKTQGVFIISPMGKAITHRDVLEKFGDKLQKVRKSQGISQEDLAVKMKMHRNYIGMVERGERNPTIRTLYKLAKALKVSADKLLPF